MKKIVKSLIVVLSLCSLLVLGIYIAPRTISSDEIVRLFTERTYLSTGYKSVVRGGAAIYINPLKNNVKMSIKDLTIYDPSEKTSEGHEEGEYLFRAKEVVVNFSIQDLVLRTVYRSIYSIEIEGMNADLEFFTDRAQKMSLFNGYKANEISKAIVIKDFISINDSKITSRDLGKHFVLNNANILAKFQNNASMRINATSYFKDKLVTLFVHFKDIGHDKNVPLKIIVTRDGNEAEINGELLNDVAGLSFSGDLKADLSRPSVLMQDFASETSFLKSLLKKKFEDQVNVSSDLILNKSEFDMTNINISSLNIQGNGNIQFMRDTNKFNGNINFQYLNLNNIFDFDNILESSISDQEITDKIFAELKSYVAELSSKQKEFFFYFNVDKALVRNSTIKEAGFVLE